MQTMDQEEHLQSGEFSLSLISVRCSVNKDRYL